MVVLEVPYISERLNYRITSLFRKEGIPVRVAHKSYTLRRALSHNNKERTCARANCPISDTRLCLLRNAVYQVTCNNCNQHYIGSTTRFTCFVQPRAKITEFTLLKFQVTSGPSASKNSGISAPVILILETSVKLIRGLSPSFQTKFEADIKGDHPYQSNRFPLNKTRKRPGNSTKRKYSIPGLRTQLG